MSDHPEYRPEYDQMLTEFFSVEPYSIKKNGGKEVRWANDVPTIKRFAAEVLKKHSYTLQSWRDAQNPDGTARHPGWRAAYDAALERQENFFVTNASHGIFNPQFAGVFAANYLGWHTDKSKIESRNININRNSNVKIKAKDIPEDQAHDFYTNYLKDQKE